MWYQDHTGLVVDFCTPGTQEVLDAGLCLMLPADVPGGSAPEQFPAQFSEEHFWWAAGSALDTNGGQTVDPVTGAVTPIAGRATLTLALEGAFAAGEVIRGDQISFSRIRVKITSIPTAGTYKVIHPYGEELFENVAVGETIFFTDDVGVGCPPSRFDCAMRGRVGPLLVPTLDPVSRTPAPYFIGPDGNPYLGDGVNSTLITNSPTNFYKFRIEGPDIGGPGINFVETDLFDVIGKVHTAPIPSPTEARRATYTRTNATGAKIDVFAAATPAFGAPPPNLSFAPGAVDPATGVPANTGVLMQSNAAGNFYGQLTLADPRELPASVTIFNNSDNPVSFINVDLADEVSITRAEHDPVARTLSITAQSGDRFRPPTLSVDLGKAVASNPLRQLNRVGANHTLVVNDVAAPPALITVLSSAGGRSTSPVSVLNLQNAGVTARNDNAATNEDTAVAINVGANDIGGVSMAIVGNPVNGTVSVVQPGTVTYTPAANFNGTDSFTYSITDAAGTVSNVATVTVTVRPINDAPVANPDTVFTVSGRAVTANVVANDTDVDGNLDANSVTLTGAAPTRGTAVANGGSITYTPTQVVNAGNVTDTVRYTVRDGANAVSNTTTLTVRIYAPEQVNIQRADYTTAQRKWDIRGTSTVPGGQTITVHLGSTVAGAVVGTAVVDNAGNWVYIVTNAAVAPDASRLISVDSTLGGFKLSQGVSIK